MLPTSDLYRIKIPVDDFVVVVIVQYDLLIVLLLFFQLLAKKRGTPANILAPDLTDLIPRTLYHATVYELSFYIL